MLLEVVANGIPVALSSAPVAGSTSPAALAGKLAPLRAEQRAGIVPTQSARPGAPVLYDTFQSLADVRTMCFVGGRIEFWLMNAAATQMAQRLGAPPTSSPSSFGSSLGRPPAAEQTARAPP